MATETEIERLVVRLVGDTRNYQKNLQAAVDASSRAKARIVSSFKSIETSLRTFGRKAGLFITKPLVAAAGLAVKAASDAEETASKFGVVFSSIADDANRMADELDKSYGLSSTGAKKLLGDTGDLLTGFGFTQQAALDLSGQVQKLAVDLASFTNIEGGAERASEALTAAILGERERVKALGIAILEKDVKEQVALNKANGLRYATERQEKAYATLQLAVRQSQNAVGDYGRTSSSTANQTRELGANIQDLRGAIGKELIPVFNKVLGIVNNVVQSLDRLNPSMKRLVVGIGALGAALGPLSIVLASVLSAVTALSLNPLVPVVTALGAAFVGAAAGAKKLAEAIKGIPKADFLKAQAEAEIRRLDKEIAKRQAEIAARPGQPKTPANIEAINEAVRRNRRFRRPVDVAIPNLRLGLGEQLQRVRQELPGERELPKIPERRSITPATLQAALSATGAGAQAKQQEFLARLGIGAGGKKPEEQQVDILEQIEKNLQELIRQGKDPFADFIPAEFNG